ncbi:hypothetical protein PTNB73_00405 [Pyrenophora teres f. teres]|uniref:Uncharacterized protein n=1 Tax=Pyrenophora teres f. teres TaxID=97479 RepID=A0A6S6V9N7_9PLEO|nr:hypothetical protein HRS9139_01647 [Pyrenophora teres f. teres]CAA9958253.1 hypothetical protein PTMSG1_01817 [Pyrenophora teres f. maculata]KAE8850579.1 hypothetical protein PTNB85_00995 [Pyrenophora teres f. teres]KAE8851388.1 hypothetical protein HRS9122_01675 [Pyrenophora teres f. teres]KAE8870059.1 hypothetical protein PTNB29_00403 [Pyrenophora teres f. teres]
MKATTLLQFTMLVLPALGRLGCNTNNEFQTCSPGFACECTFNGDDDNRCGVWGKFHGLDSFCVISAYNREDDPGVCVW